MSQEKPVLSKQEFEKKVEIESAHLMHYDRLSKKEADEVARNYISSKYESKS